jgi:hypothetical protein
MQDFLAILIVAIAAAFLAHRAWRRLIRRSGHACGSCAGCAAGPKSQVHQLVTISTAIQQVKNG